MSKKDKRNKGRDLMRELKIINVILVIAIIIAVVI